MQVVELGGVRLHVLVAHPGLPGEADRVVQAVKRAEPAVLLLDIDATDALNLRSAVAADKPFVPSFVDALFAAETERRFGQPARTGAKPAEHALAAGARAARDKRADVIPIRPLARKPGFFERARARRIASGAQASDPAAFADAFATALSASGIWPRAAEVEAAHERALTVLRDGRAPLVALVQAHRASAYMQQLAKTRRIPG